MAKVLMIRPIHPHFQGINKTATPPLGLMTLAAYAREKRPGKDVFRIVDERITLRDKDQWSEFIEDFQPDLIAFSVLSVEEGRLHELAAWFKAGFPHIPIIMGGPLASGAGARIFEPGKIDYMIRGEGEVAFVDFLEALNQGDRYPESPVSGLVFMRPDGSLVENPMNLHVPEVEDIPFPAWDLIDLSDYEKFARMTPTDTGARYALLFTSRGCPYGCVYCHKIFAKKFRPMAAKRVVDEMEYLVNTYQVHIFEIIDDIFNLDYQRAMDVCHEIKRRGLKVKISFPNGVRADLLDQELIKELASAGTYEMAFAVESASPRVQKYIRKNVDLKKIKKNIAIAADAGVFTWGFFMLGFPTETRRELLKTLWFAYTSKLHGAYFFTVIPFEGTKIAEMAREQNTLTDVDFCGDYNYIQQSISKTVSAQELSFYQALAYSGFFFDPRRIYRILRDYPHEHIQVWRKFFTLNIYLFVKKPLSWLKSPPEAVKTPRFKSHRSS